MFTSRALSLSLYLSLSLSLFPRLSISHSHSESSHFEMSPTQYNSWIYMMPCPSVSHMQRLKETFITSTHLSERPESHPTFKGGKKVKKKKTSEEKKKCMFERMRARGKGSWSTSAEVPPSLDSVFSVSFSESLPRCLIKQQLVHFHLPRRLFLALRLWTLWATNPTIRMCFYQLFMYSCSRGLFWLSKSSPRVDKHFDLHTGKQSKVRL